MIRDYAIFALNNLRARKLRTFLTILGIVVGIAAVVGLIGIGQGLEHTITDQFQALGGNKLFVAPQGVSFGAGTTSGKSGLDETDVKIVQRVRGIEQAGGMISKLGQVKFNGETKTSSIAGFPQDDTKELFSQLQNTKIVEGRDLRASDKNSAVIGHLIATGDFFTRKVSLHDTIIVEDKEFKVAGILSQIGNPQDDTQIIIPLDTARIIFNEPTKYSFILGQVQEGSSPSAVAEEIKHKLRVKRNVEEGKEDFEVSTFEQILQTFSSVLLVVQAILIGIASISLLVGGIGIMNTMYTSVIQRTQQIGVMKAIGAKNKDILTIFLIESGLLGLTGGAIGIFIGWGMGKLVETGASTVGIPFQSQFSLTLVFFALAFSFLVGSIAGVAPARVASQLKPIEALRYE